MSRLLTLTFMILFLCFAGAAFGNSSGDVTCPAEGVSFHYEIVGPDAFGAYTVVVSNLVFDVGVHTACLKYSCFGGAPWVDIPVDDTHATFMCSINCTTSSQPNTDPTIVCCNDVPCPVDMVSFTASAGNNRVVIRWRTESETNNSHFTLYRSSDASVRGEQIARVTGNGTTGDAHDYVYIDTRVSNGTEYCYRIGDVNFDGEETEYSVIVRATPTATALGVVPIAYALHENYPNPFNPTTEITYGIRTGGHVRLTVHDLNGREVAQLVNEYQAANTYCVKFDASNLASGVYVYTLSTSGFTTSKRMVVMK